MAERLKFRNLHQSDINKISKWVLEKARKVAHEVGKLYLEN
jgi:hypothetical protein